MPPETPSVRRGFVEIAEGQVHYRYAGGHNPEKLPLILLHPSPGSSRMMEPLLRAFGRRRFVLAPDTLGNGDSAAPSGSALTIHYFSDAHIRALDALQTERFDLYGSHTGANIACEIAIAHPGRVRRLILDGISLYTEAERQDMLTHYAPGVTLDQYGSQFAWIWNFVRDSYIFWPWYQHTSANRRNIGLPDADTLHDKTVEVLKAARTYHIPYRAAIAYDKAPRLPMIRIPTLLACAADDMFLEYFEQVQALMPKAFPCPTNGTATPENLASTVRTFEAFLDQELPGSR